MGAPTFSQEHKPFLELRSRILKRLYEKFREFPYAQVELSELGELCGADAKNLNWNIVYLEKCGYVELGRSTDCFPYVACSAVITAGGIDLVENPSAFGRRFAVPGEAEPSPAGKPSV